ncbi:hypothetical protein L1887_34542 [Cichorium endivia]|nr:hypothetical protein L1887_34542 [Cichorium endivia]
MKLDFHLGACSSLDHGTVSDVLFVRLVGNFILRGLLECGALPHGFRQHLSHPTSVNLISLFLLGLHFSLGF